VGHFKRGPAIGTGDRKPDFAIVYDAVDVENAARNEALDQEIGLRITEGFEDRPELIGLVELSNPDRPRHRARLERPRRGDCGKEASQPRAIEDVKERRDAEAGIRRRLPHGKLVAEAARRSLTHPRDAQMLAQHGAYLAVEIVERTDAIEDARARQVGDGIAHVAAVSTAPLRPEGRRCRRWIRKASALYGGTYGTAPSQSRLCCRTASNWVLSAA
jgi:hypothetical protein